MIHAVRKIRKPFLCSFHLSLFACRFNKSKEFTIWQIILTFHSWHFERRQKRRMHRLHPMPKTPVAPLKWSRHSNSVQPLFDYCSCACVYSFWCVCVNTKSQIKYRFYSIFYSISTYYCRAFHIFVVFCLPSRWKVCISRVSCKLIFFLSLCFFCIGSLSLFERAQALSFSSWLTYSFRWLSFRSNSNRPASSIRFSHSFASYIIYADLARSKAESR